MAHPSKQMVEDHVWYQQGQIIEDLLDAGVLDEDSDIQNRVSIIDEDELPNRLPDEYKAYQQAMREWIYDEDFSFDDWLDYNGDDSSRYDYRDWLEIWLVSRELGQRLVNAGEMIIDKRSGVWWLRTTTGGAIYQDEVMMKIASEWPKYALPHVWLSIETAESFQQLLGVLGEEAQYQMNEAPFEHTEEGQKAWQEIADNCEKAGNALGQEIADARRRVDVTT